MEQINQGRTNHWAERLAEKDQMGENQRSRGSVHACRASQRGLQQAQDRLRRANRDLGETAAFVAALLTTATAAEAVVNISIEKIDMSKEILQGAFGAYSAVFILVLVWGAIRGSRAIRRRAQAEKDVDQAKKGIFEFCPGDQWPMSEE